MVSCSNISFLSSSSWAIKLGLIISGIISAGRSIMISWIISSFSINRFTVSNCFSINRIGSITGSIIGSIISGSIISGAIKSSVVSISGVNWKLLGGKVLLFIFWNRFEIDWSLFFSY